MPLIDSRKALFTQAYKYEKISNFFVKLGHTLHSILDEN